MKALIVGNGKVGRTLADLLRTSPIGDWQVEAFVGRKADDAFVKAVANVDVVFIAIPTKDQGETALDYILKARAADKPVVTCEKGSLAYHYSVLKPHLSKIGFTSTVGGGSGMLRLLTGPKVGKTEAIYGIVNATINYLLWRIQSTKDIGAAIEEAMALGLPDPGARSLVEIFNTEVSDCIMKACILFNVAELGEPISPSMFERRQKAKTELDMTVRSGLGVRFVVMITKPEANELARPKNDVFSMQQLPWVIRGTFMGSINWRFGTDVIGAQNALVVNHEYSGLQKVIGLGAGLAPTAITMLEDATRLLEIK